MIFLLGFAFGVVGGIGFCIGAAALIFYLIRAYASIA